MRGQGRHARQAAAWPIYHTGRRRHPGPRRRRLAALTCRGPRAPGRCRVCGAVLSHRRGGARGILRRAVPHPSHRPGGPGRGAGTARRSRCPGRVDVRGRGRPARSPEGGGDRAADAGPRRCGGGFHASPGHWGARDGPGSGSRAGRRARLGKRSTPAMAGRSGLCADVVGDRGGAHCRSSARGRRPGRARRRPARWGSGRGVGHDRRRPGVGAAGPPHHHQPDRRRPRGGTTRSASAGHRDPRQPGAPRAGACA